MANTQIKAPQKLTLRSTNLFSNGYIVDFPRLGESLLLRDIISFVPDADDQYHPVIQNERLDLIAYSYYGDSVERAAELWWVIADANNIFNPFDLSMYVGQSLLIPSIQKVLLLL